MGFRSTQKPNASSSNSGSAAPTASLGPPPCSRHHPSSPYHQAPAVKSSLLPSSSIQRRQISFTSFLVTQRNIGWRGSEGMVGMELGAWCLGMKGQKNYFNTTGPQNSDKLDMKVRGFLHYFYIHKISYCRWRWVFVLIGIPLLIFVS